MKRLLYRWMSGDRELPTRSDLDAETVRALPHNFVLYVGSHTLTKLGDALMNPKTTLSWLGAAIGAPTWSLSLLVPLRESGSMLLQFLLSGWLERLRYRKRAWAVGSLIQGACVFGMAGVAVVLQGTAAGLALLGLLAAFALARSVCSVAAKDVLGRTVPKRRRGRASGWAASAAGLITLAVGGGLLLGAKELHADGLAWLLTAAAACWLIASLSFLRMREPAAEPDPPRRSPWRRLRLLYRDPLLRRFVIARSLLLCSALSAPYYLVLAQRHGDNGGPSLLAFIVLGGLASLCGGPLWGRGADHSSRYVLSGAALIAAATGSAVWAIALWQTAWLALPWLLPLAYFLLSLAHEGVRIGRKTWIVDIAEGERRRDYVAVSNSAIGLTLLAVGGLSAVLAEFSLIGALLALSLSGLFGALLSARLPEAEQDDETT